MKLLDTGLEVMKKQEAVIMNTGPEQVPLWVDNGKPVIDTVKKFWDNGMLRLKTHYECLKDAEKLEKELENITQVQTTGLSTLNPIQIGILFKFNVVFVRDKLHRSGVQSGPKERYQIDDVAMVFGQDVKSLRQMIYKRFKR